jgi:ribonucleoside-diphosphate reductase alpha chain
VINFVTKANGKKEAFDVYKIRKWSEFAAEGKLNWSDIELEAVKRCFDGVSTRDLHKAMIAACIDKKDKKYSDMAGRLLLGQIYKDAHGGFNSIPKFVDFVHLMISKNLWEKMDYSDEELEELGKEISHNRNLKYSFSVLKQLVDKYLIKDNISDVVHESPQFAFMGIAMKAMEIQPKERRLTDVKKAYKYISELKINLPSPYLTTMRTPIKGTASCCVLRADDTASSLSVINHLAHEFTLANAGIGAYIQTRATGQGVKQNRIIHGGLLPYYRWMESSVGASRQSSRGGSATITFTCLEPDIEDLIRLKHPTTPIEKRVDKLDYCIVVNNSFLRRAAKKEEWMLVSYDEAPELYEALYKSEEEFEVIYEKIKNKRKVKKTFINAQFLLKEIVKQRAETGRIYFFFANNVNKHTPFKETIYQTNLCVEVFLPTKPFHSMENLYTGADINDGEVALCFLSSIVAGRVKPQEYEDVAYYTLLIIDNVIETMKYPFKHVEMTAKKRRSVGVGITNMAYYLASNGLKYTSEEGKKLMHEYAEQHYYWLAEASLRLAKEKGNAEWMDKTKWPDGWLPIDTYNKNVDSIADFELNFDWEGLRKDIVEQGGIRNSVLVATAPNESSSLVSESTNSIYPVRDLMVFKQSQKGNVLFFAPDYNKLKNSYQIAWGVPSKDVAEMYGIFSKFCDQGISPDNWVDLSGEKKLDLPEQIRYILLAAKLGVKSLYYLNSRTKSSDSIATQVELDEEGCEACKL